MIRIGEGKVSRTGQKATQWTTMTAKRRPGAREGEEEMENDAKKKKGKATVSPSPEPPSTLASGNLGEDLVFEVLRHADATTLGRAACVSRQWRRTAEDERLWETVCTRHWTQMGCGDRQLRSVVLALGGFRRLHRLYLLPLRQPSRSLNRSSSLLPISPSSSSLVASPSSPGSSSSSLARTKMGGQGKGRWGKDEVNLSLSLLSIQHYCEKMGTNVRSAGWRSS